MSITINKDGMYVNSKNPNIFIGSAFKENDASLIQEIPVDSLIKDIGIKIDIIV